jgi:hypothetical protein
MVNNPLRIERNIRVTQGHTGYREHSGRLTGRRSFFSNCFDDVIATLKDWMFCDTVYKCSSLRSPS